MKKITAKDLPNVASCKIQCVYRRAGICRDVKINRKNSDASCHNLSPSQLTIFLDTELKTIKTVEICEQQELVLELAEKGIPLNYLEKAEIGNILEQLALQNYRNF